MIIGRHPAESALMTVPTSARVLYECVTPWADELYFEGRLTERQRHKFRRHEAAILEDVDYLSFGWETYALYALNHYGISGRNLLELIGAANQPGSGSGSASSPCRLLSSLSSQFINLPLLSRLSKLYPIDVYGGPPPDPSLGLNYLGWAPPSVLQDYQLGLITCSKDELRREGFSAKTVAYISRACRSSCRRGGRHMEPTCVPYDEDTFLDVIERLSDEEEWQRVSDEAYAQALELTWERVLQPLEKALRDPSYRYVTPHMKAVIGGRSKGATALT